MRSTPYGSTEIADPTLVLLVSEVAKLTHQSRHAALVGLGVAHHPLNLRPHRFFTADGLLILCNSHGALFERATGYCVAGPCAGQSLEALPLTVEGDFILLAQDYPLPEP